MYALRVQVLRIPRLIIPVKVTNCRVSTLSTSPEQPDYPTTLGEAQSWKKLLKARRKPQTDALKFRLLVGVAHPGEPYLV